MIRRICVFCGSAMGRQECYGEAADALGRAIALRGIGLVYGGAHVGLMGRLADAALAAGGEVTGVIPAAMVHREIAHRGLTELRIVSSMHERKAAMAELSDAFIALPGGIGTFEEFCEILTWNQLGLQSKPCGLLNVAGYYDPLLRLFHHAAAEGFLKLRTALIAGTDAESLLERLVA